MTIYAEGDPNAKILVLSAAPSTLEIRLKKLFSGPAGDVFHDCLHQAGIFRHDCYLMNIFPYPVMKDKIGNLYDGGRMLWHIGKGFTDAGLEDAQPALEHIQTTGANVIMAMGPQALALLSGDIKPRPLGKWRGSPLWSSVVEKKFIPTYHPSDTMHGTYLWRYPMMNDMAKVKLDMDHVELHIPQRNIRLRPNLQEVLKYLQECKYAGRVATDLEVINHQVYCFSLSHDPKDAMVVPLVDKDGRDWFGEDEEIVLWKAYATIMSDPKVMKINQNLVGFDSVFLLLQNNIHVKGTLGDTMIAQHIMYPEFPKGIDFISSMHTREPYWKDDGKIWKTDAKFDWEKFQIYCGRDAAVCLEAWDVLAEELNDGYWPAYNMTVRLAQPLAYMSVRGLKVDIEGLAQTKINLGIEIERKLKELEEIADFPFSPTSPKQCQKYFYEHLKIKPYRNAEGGVTTDDRSMSRIFRKGGKGSKEAKLVQDIRALLKLKGTYVDVDLDGDHRLRCSWNPRGTWTGRLSSSKTILGKGLNLQNLHPKFKGFIVSG
jgi:uracil-DNA glycosylase